MRLDLEDQTLIQVLTDLMPVVHELIPLGSVESRNIPAPDDGDTAGTFASRVQLFWSPRGWQSAPFTTEVRATLRDPAGIRCYYIRVNAQFRVCFR